MVGKTGFLTAALLVASTSLEPVAAATATGNLGVKMTLQSTCTVATPSLLDFGIWGTLSSNVDMTQTLAVTCTNLTPYAVSLGPGTGLLATVNSRRMSGILPLFFVNYSLYRNAARTQVWGNTVGVNTVAGTGNGSVQNHMVYGRVPAQGTPLNGTYNDTVAVTVTY